MEETQKLIQNLLGDQEPLQKIEKLFGEASYRVYYRVWSSQRTLIVMQLPAGIQSASEEITNYQGSKDELPFINVQRYLFGQGLPLPQIIKSDLVHGLVLLEDLGDQSFEKCVIAAGAGSRLKLYQSALDLLLQLQKVGEQHPDPTCIAFQRSFDLNLLTWEFDHFLEYGIEDRLEVKIPEAKKTQLRSLALQVIEPIVKIPYGLTHRDFQSRNLMAYQNQFYLIDFQDALQGPPQYDLVALLRDSYIQLAWEEVDALLKYYWQARKKLGLKEMNEEEFYKNFHRITLQRKLKDAGRFQYIYKVKKNPNFLPHTPSSLAYVKQAFYFLPEYRELQKELAFYLPELAE